jgi:hypothetical protein
MAIKQIASVDPKALKETANKIKVLQEELETIKKQLNTGITDLNTSGFKDIKFKELSNVVQRTDGDMKGLLGFLQRYEAYIRSQEKIINEFLNSQTLR